MRLLVASSNYLPNGAVVYASRIIPLLQAAGHDVWLAASPGSWIESTLAGRVPLFATEFRRWPVDELDRAAAFCRRERIDLVHSHLTRASNFAAMLRARHGVTSVAHLHANHPQLHVGFHDLLIAVSEDTRRRHRLFPMGWSAAIEHLPNFVDPAEFAPAPEDAEDGLRAALEVAPGTPVVLVAGALCARKGQDVAVRAFAQVRRAHPEAVLALVGRGSLPPGLPMEGVRLLGHRPDLPAWLPHATVVLVPSRDEPFGLAAIEAMACGVPVVATAAGGLAEVAADGAAVLVRPGDDVALAAATIRLLSEPGHRRAQALRGRQAALARYAPEDHVRGLVAAYRRALDESFA